MLASCSAEAEQLMGVFSSAFRYETKKYASAIEQAL